MDLPESSQIIIYLTVFPLIGACIGWLTNRLAIQMLFRPREPINFLGLRVQGLIPKRQSELAKRVGEIVESELFNQHLIRNEIHKIDLQPYLDELATNIVWDRLAPKLRQIPLLGNFVNDKLLYNLTKVALESLSAETEPLLEKVSTEVERKIAVRKIVEEKIHAFDLDQLESIVRKLAQKEFRSIEILGGVIGFLIGLVQAGLVLVI
ncbi:DUF445 family protein [Puniceicoccales bacterium CK1056]|uniref:DUF445 family protein n=1 Tax=Oceanipulchritudo coccoides TaxID=2706888 RepID=A0A6B2M0J7_9BACT|nr:DUF445 family protein [Oceanipulchritudo coccoides]NDV62481.1 DUF445 family protein [Oceanipulchritudo coccoides]